jgi:hypothetical protein
LAMAMTCDDPQERLSLSDLSEKLVQQKTQQEEGPPGKRPRLG